jgi:hypothetical protein
LAAFAATRLAAAFLVTFVDVMVVLLAIAFTPPIDGHTIKILDSSPSPAWQPIRVQLPQRRPRPRRLNLVEPPRD